MNKVTEQWFAFRAHNTQTQYGYGTREQAEIYADHLNARREINVYGVYPLSATEAEELRLDEGYHDSFNLAE